MQTSDFLAMARQAEVAPHEADFVALRQAYIASKAYAPTSHYSRQKLIGNTNSLDNLDEVVAFCEDILQHNPMDLEARILLDFAYSQQGRTADADRQQAFIKGMLQALANSGDGQSPATAWHVVAVAEEYTFISVLGLKSHGQQLIEDNGERWFDVLVCSPRGQQNADDPEADSEDAVELYFDITAPFMHLQNMIK